MKDLIRAILGPTRCDWCTDRGSSWWDRLMRFDHPMPTKERPWHERAFMKLNDFYLALGIWKLGRMWHVRYHK